MKRKLFILTIISLLALAVLLVVIRKGSVPLSNFKRHFFEKERLATELIGISGVSCEKLLSVSSHGAIISTSRPNELVIVKGKLIKVIDINEGSFFNAPQGNYKEVADSSAIYIFKLNSDSFLSASPWTLSTIVRHCPSFAFSRCAMLDSNLFVFRKYKSTISDQVFERLSTPGNLNEEKGISEIHHDWGMSTDGMLLCNRKLKMFIYIYFYLPKAILFDDSLHFAGSITLLGSATQQVSVVNVLQNAKSHVVTTDAPLFQCNSHACTFKNYLLIHSGAISKNEKSSMFGNFETFDLYNLRSLKYLGSYHLPRYGSARIRDLKWYDDTLYVLYHNRLAKFSMPLF